MSATRTYRSPLREQQAEQTRDLIIDGATELLCDPSTTELTVALAAERAGVSVRTAYRYFPTKEALYEAMDSWFMRRWGPVPRWPETLAELPDLVRRLYISFDDNERVLRASTRMPHAIEMRARRKQNQARTMLKVIEHEAPGLPAPEARRFAGALHSLLSADNYLNLRDTWGLSLEEATESTLWGIEAIAAALRRVAKKTKGGQ